MKRLTIFLTLLMLLPLGAGAEQIFRSVDRQGHVTFSDEPLQNAVDVDTVKLPEEPSEAEISRAQERVKQTEALADKMRQQRLPQEAANRQQQKEQEQETANSRGDEDQGAYRDYAWGFPVNEYHRRRQDLKRKLLEHGWKPGDGRPGRPSKPVHLPARPTIGTR